MQTTFQAPRFHFVTKCYGSDGIEKWSEEHDNLVVDSGRKDIIDQYFPRT